MYYVFHKFTNSLAVHFSFSKLGLSPSTSAPQSTENKECHDSYKYTDDLTAMPRLRCDGVSFAWIGASDGAVYLAGVTLL